MPKFYYDANGFGKHWGNLLNGRNELICTWSEIIWAAITVGKRNLTDVWKYNQYSFFEAIFRTTMIFANLMTQDTGNKNKDYRILKTDVYKSLDPSEKNAISYFIGLMSTKLIAGRLFNIPWLMHLDVYKKSVNIKTINGDKSRPDFIGINSSNKWFVFEAKGRSHSFNKEALNKAKMQTRKLRKISGNYPNLRVAVQSSFSGDYFQIAIEDPDEYDKSAIDIEMDIKEFIFDYYKLVANLLFYKKDYLEPINIGGIYFMVANLSEINLKIGLQKEIYNLFLDQSDKDKSKFKLEDFYKIMTINKLKNIHSINLEDNMYLGNDGIIIISGELWNIENMNKQPYERE
ncbi:hypothetical protein [Clostridium tyrobutyricum]|uniref:hypothetical protein n=1 Tax=Clostridium tyrobutyricum TaxID=1519 RepID=UPI001C3937C6|nr:hypothetical protein [Clostridium tyrobutyricum]MBV4425521.1 hypothetical protein [Clostridium tyrobutyricum]